MISAKLREAAVAVRHARGVYERARKGGPGRLRAERALEDAEAEWATVATPEAVIAALDHERAAGASSVAACWREPNQ